MGTEADHIALANKNHAVLVHLLEDVEKFPEWVTVVAFYKALQVVEAMFVHKHGRSCHGHPERLSALKTRGYQEEHKHFRALWAASSVARYLHDADSRTTYCSFADFMSPDRVRKFVQKRLGGVECNAVRHLSDEGKKALKRFTW